MAGLIKKEAEKANRFQPYYHSDLYGLDQLYFSEIRPNELWDLSLWSESSPLLISFLLMRSMLHFRASGTPLRISELGRNCKKLFSYLPMDEFEFLQTEEFIPQLLNANQKLNFHWIGKEPDLKSGFRMEESKGAGKGCQFQAELLANVLERKRILEISSKLAEKQVEGSLFLRTESEGWFYRVYNGRPGDYVFLQSKPKIHTPFLFVCSLDSA